MNLKGCHGRLEQWFLEVEMKQMSKISKTLEREHKTLKENYHSLSSFNKAPQIWKIKNHRIRVNPLT